MKGINKPIHSEFPNQSEEPVENNQAWAAMSIAFAKDLNFNINVIYKL